MTKNVMLVFGSGGHTTEMLMMVGSCPQDECIFNKYNHVYFVIGASDTWSYTKIKDFFKTKQNLDIEHLQRTGKLTVLRVFRAREVKQSYLSSVGTTLWALLHSFWLVAKTMLFERQLDLVLTNGPGTSLPIMYAYFVLSKVLLFNLNAKILFVESFCRVQELSLTAKLIRPICSVMVVQWPELHAKYPNTKLFTQKIL